MINQLVDTNPSAVLDQALTPSERAALPAAARAYVEQRVTVDGELAPGAPGKQKRRQVREL